MTNINVPSIGVVKITPWNEIQSAIVLDRLFVDEVRIYELRRDSDFTVHYCLADEVEKASHIREPV